MEYLPFIYGEGEGLILSKGLIRHLYLLEFDNYEEYVDNNIGIWNSTINENIASDFNICIVEILYLTVNEIKTCKRNLMELYNRLADDEYENKDKVMELIKTVSDVYSVYYNSNTVKCRIVRKLF